MNERWADIPGWPGYRISSEGRLLGKRGRLMRTSKDRGGYVRVYLGLRLRGRNVFVHRLVLSAFVGQIPEGHQANHKNGVRHDNRLENLEVLSPAANMQHSFRDLGRVQHSVRALGEAHGNAKLTADKVKEIRRLYATGLVQTELAKRLGLSQAHISQIVRRKWWAHIT